MTAKWLITKVAKALLTALLLTALAAPLLMPSTAKAESFIVVYDQEDNVVTSKVEFVGARLYNETHAIIEDQSFVTITYKGVELYSLNNIKDNTTYEAKVALNHLILEVPKGLYYKVTHFSTGLVFEGISEGRLVNCGLLPYGHVEVYVKGSQELRELINWQGGPIKIKEREGVELKAFLLLLPSLIPAIAPFALSAYYMYTRHKFLASVKTPSSSSLSFKADPGFSSSSLQPEPVTRIVTTSLTMEVRREEDRVMKALKVASKSPMSIADLIERDAMWFERELRKAEKCSRWTRIKSALARLRERTGLCAEEKVKRLRCMLMDLIHEITNDKIDIVIYAYYPKAGKNKPYKGMKRLRGLLKSLALALCSPLSLARREVHNSARPFALSALVGAGKKRKGAR